MRVRYLLGAGGALVSASLSTALLTGCGLAFGQDGPDEPQGAPTPEGAAQEAVVPEHNVINDDVLIIVDDGAQVSEECGDREVVVSADDAVVVLDGDCGLVRATGRGSTVDVGSADKIVLVGVDNTVSFASGDPEVINHGRNTTVTEGGSADE
ncbi:DUF3060 domain-containing protein [Nocardiopsis sp. CT-R113]|uniref:DUF3060 domain-containing protein n=1 Tax=Nocardiopsis codii TaxID=3065942 RepID=A0ABU7K882_9ACTN|nr:DUF3060 domain-containing protein [Nocardiopsis sp. CT-R113]MEE2038451.1 DUF3060 domain-containing protein [Nocardiopsis sp. CT-R113]